MRSEYSIGLSNLHSVGESLVEAADLRRDTEVNSAVAHLNNQTTENIRVDLEIELLVILWNQRFQLSS